MVGTDIGLLCHCNEARLGLLLGENVAGVAVRVVPQWAEIVRRSERTLDCWVSTAVCCSGLRTGTVLGYYYYTVEKDDGLRQDS